MEKTTLTKNQTAKVQTKTGKEYSYQYIDIAQIHEYLEANKMSYYQYIDRLDGDDYIMTVKIIDGKEQQPLRGSRVVDATLMGNNNPAQIQGSALTYARRYSLLMAFGLATEDDDAQSLTVKKEWTYEEAQNYEITFGKHKGKKIKDIPQSYLDWLLESDKADLAIKTVIETFYKGKGINILTDEEKSLKMDLMGKLGDIMLERDIDREKLLAHYKVSSDSEMTIDQLKDAIKKLEGK